MKYWRLALIGFLSLASSAAMAQWSKVGTNSIGAANDNYETIYVDYKTATKKDGKNQMWFLSSYSRYWQAPYHSVKSLLEFDCLNNRFRRLQELTYYEQMGRGRPMGDTGRDENAEWWVPLEESPGKNKFDLACHAKGSK